MIRRVVGRLPCFGLRRQFAGLTNRSMCQMSTKPEPEQQITPKGRKLRGQRENERYERGMKLLKERLAKEEKERDQANQSEPEKPPTPENENEPNKKSSRFKWGLGFFLLGMLAYDVKKWLLSSETALTFDQFLEMLENGRISKVHIKNTVHGNHIVSETEVSTPNHTYRMAIGNLDTFKNRIEAFNSRGGFRIPITESRHESTDIVLDKIYTYVKFAMEAAIVAWLLLSIKKLIRSPNFESSMMSGVNYSKSFRPQVNLETRFKDVAGLADAKLEITEFVDFLKNPQKYKDLGARIPKGALLSGPPGTGKTMLAKACSGEAGVPFFSASGSEFMEIFVGVGASRVRQLFKEARAKTPSIIFIDEIDAIGRKRQDAGRSGNDERANTLNQLLVQMDGFGTSTDVIVLAATNRKQLLDSALTRPGRFDRSIEITLPDLEGRKEIFMTHLKPLKLSTEKPIEEYAKRLATLTPGFSGADIYNICNEAAILSARQNKSYVESIDFEMATERVIGGVQKKKIMTQKERRIVAYHECGHAVVSWFLEGAHPLLKLTIIPRSKGALGFAQYLPSETHLQSKEELLDKICVILGGRCSEQHFFKRVTTGAHDDLQKVYKFARRLVINYGMSDAIGYVSPRQSQYEKDYSEELNQTIDEEVTKISKECTQRARVLVKDHADKIERLAERLLQKETLDSKDIREILGERPFAAKSNYRDYLEQTAEK